MSLLIPQTALDSIVCDSCHKYLSVIPVKVFPNRRIKCGRCISEEDDGGVISMYNQVAKKGIFNCINHYEGCKALLYSSEVQEHEQTCKSEKYECPNCDEEILSYFVYKHFTIKHKELILKKTYFAVNESEKDVHFLYCYKGYLIFVKYSSHKQPYNNSTNVHVKFSLLNSKTTETVKVNVLINCGDFIKEMKTDCDIFPLDAGNDFKVELDLKEHMLVVSFSLEEPKCKVTAQKAVIKKKVEKPKENYIRVIPKAVNIQQSESFDDKLSEKLLSLYFKRKNKCDFFSDQEFVWVSDLSHNLITETRLRNMVFSCFMCSLEYDNPMRDYYHFAYECNKYYLICHMCQQAQNWPEICLVPYRYVTQTGFRCKWECGKLLGIFELQKHERYCFDQISQPCPVKLCNFSSKFFKIKEHFKKCHPNLLSPVFHESSHGEALNLVPSASPLNIIYIVSHIYIGIELIWDKSEWKISLTCTIPNARPRMVINQVISSRTNMYSIPSSPSYKFVTLIKGNGSCPNLVDIKYKCYLADPEKEQLLE